MTASGVAHGTVSPGFEEVRYVFERNFAERRELGAAFAAYRHGKALVDLWGGIAEASNHAAWDRDTLQVIFSGTKGLVALCLLMLVDREQIDLEAPVARYWPEFASQGKENVRVLDIACHRARLPGFLAPVREDEVVDDRLMASLLADQPLDPDPRASRTYHALTYGWLCGELIRRVDGRSVGRFFDEEIATPLRLEIWIGLPAWLEPRVAELVYDRHRGADGLYERAASGKDDLLARVWNNPPLFPRDRIPSNARAWHGAEIPAAGAIGTARSVARLYSCLASGGALDGVRLLSAETLAVGRQVREERWEPLLDEPQRFGVGLELQTDSHALGPPDDAFGHRGAGGSTHCAWPTQGIGLSYAMNSLRDDEGVDPRASELLRVLYDCARLAGMP